jgi:opacity protein-like surface antigen
MRPALLAAAVAALLLIPALAAAEPARTGKISEAAATYEWTGGPIAGAGGSSGEDCAAPSCEETLLQLDIAPGATGKLKIDIADFNTQDLELYVFSSDASGKPIKLLGASEGAPGAAETFTVGKAAAGYYLVQVSAYIAAGATYSGKAVLTGVTAGAPAVPPAASPPVGGDQVPASGGLTASIAVGPAKPKDAAKAGVPVKVDCSVVCKGSLSVEVSAAQARKLKLGKRKTVIGKGTIRVDKRNQLVFLELSGKAAKRVARAKSVKLAVKGALTDDQGTQRKTVGASGTLKR